MICYFRRDAFPGRYAYNYCWEVTNQFGWGFSVVFLDTLPGGPDVDEFGEIHLTRPGKAWLTLLMPSLILVVYGGFLLFILFQ